MIHQKALEKCGEERLFQATYFIIREMIFYRDGMNEVLSNWLTSNGRDFFSVYTISEGVINSSIIWKHRPLLTHGIKHLVQIEPSSPYPINILD